MQEKDLQVNIDKSHFAVKQVEYLEYILSTKGVRPQPKEGQGNLRCR